MKKLSRIQEIKNGKLEGGFHLLQKTESIFAGLVDTNTCPTNNCNSGNCTAGCGKGQNVVAGCGVK